MTSKYATSSRRIDVITTSFQRCVPVGQSVLFAVNIPRIIRLFMQTEKTDQLRCTESEITLSPRHVRRTWAYVSHANRQIRIEFLSKLQHASAYCILSFLYN